MSNILKLHFICLALALLDLLFVLLEGISFRGQWLDILLSFAPITTAVMAVCGSYRSLSLATRIYLPAAISINLLLAPIYLFGTIFYPLDTFAEAGRYEARERMGVLSPPAVNLICKWGPFEKLVSPNLSYDIEGNGNSRIGLVFKRDSVGVVLPKYSRPDTTLYFAD